MRVEGHYTGMENGATEVIDLPNHSGYSKVAAALVLSSAPRAEKGIQSRYFFNEWAFFNIPIKQLQTQRAGCYYFIKDSLG